MFAKTDSNRARPAVSNLAAAPVVSTTAASPMLVKWGSR
jgi:hypothetical protein